MPNKIDTTTMPGDSMTPATIEAAARNMRTVGTKVSTQGGTVLTTWQKISASYDAPEENTLFHAMNPVKTEAESFGTDVGSASTALETFAEEVRTIKAAVATIRADAATFLSGIAGGVEKKHYGVHGAVSTETIEWHEDQASVNANNDLIRRTNDQQEALWAAERKCANAIYDVIGHPHIEASSAANCGQGYGVDEIPDNAEMPWGQTVARTENCGEKVVHGVANGAGSMIGGFAQLVGFKYTGTGLWDHWDWSWDWSGANAGEAWKGVGMFVVGAATLGPGGFALSTIPGPVGSFFGDSQKVAVSAVAGLVAIDLYAEDPLHKWKEGGWEAVGESGFNIATLFAAPTKLGSVGKLGRVGEVAAKVTDPVYLALQAGRAAKALAGPTLEALSRLNRAIDLDGLVKVDPAQFDIPSVRREDVSTDVPNTGNRDGVDAPPPRDYAGDQGGSDAGPKDSGTDADSGSTSDSGSTQHDPDSSSSDPTSSDQTSPDPTPADHTPVDHTPVDPGHTGGDGQSTGHSGADDGRGAGTQESPRQYEYSNPAESLRDTPEPDLMDTADLGPSKQYEAGTQEHLEARWNEYQDRNGAQSWEVWRDGYIRNQGHAPRGAAYEQAFFDTREFSSADWDRNTYVPESSGVRRNYDIMSATDQVAYELKSGGSIDARQLAKDQQLVDAGWDVHYVFGKDPSAAVIAKLENAGVTYEVFYGEPVLVKAGP